jgi:predicted nucleic acid-binding protein
MPAKVGLDTTFVLALIDAQDLWHQPAQQLQLALAASDIQTYIFDCVTAEVISALARRIHEKRRAANLPDLVAQLKSRFPTKALTWLYPDLPQHYEQVLALVEETGGERNFNDALILISCRNREIPYLASFDSDFDNREGLKRLALPDDLPGANVASGAR